MITFQVPGKWILAGEHSVLRNYEAIVFPLKSKYLKLIFSEGNEDLSLSITGNATEELEIVIWSVIERALSLLQIKRSSIKGHLIIDSQIQFGAGMGASATLSVAIARWLKHLNLLSDDLFVFAKKIEDLFHGESSGVDIAVALYEKPLVFKRNSETLRFIDTTTEKGELPQLFLSYTGVRGVTKDCVQQVKSLHAKNPDFAQLIDQRMQQSVEGFKKLLNSSSGYQDNLNLWKENMDLAQSCFEDWGLVNDQVRRHQDLLRTYGAITSKLTGSGSGGYVLSLWASRPVISDAELSKTLISVNFDKENLKDEK